MKQALTDRTTVDLNLLMKGMIILRNELHNGSLRAKMVVERDHHGFDAPAPLGHPARASLPNGHPTGPAVGERLPEFHLTNAYGETIDYHVDRARRKSVVVFYRSAVW